MTMSKDEIEAAILELRERMEALESSGNKQRGPKVERAMTEADAFRVKFGDLKKPMSHKDAADKLGLSYGQVFSCRGGYTFKQVKATWQPPKTEGAQDA